MKKKIVMKTPCKKCIIKQDRNTYKLSVCTVCVLCIKLFASESEWQKIEQVPIPLPRASRNSLYVKTRKFVFCYKKFSDLLWEKMVLVIEKNFRGWRPRICKIFEITRTIHSNSAIVYQRTPGPLGPVLKKF